LEEVPTGFPKSGTEPRVPPRAKGVAYCPRERVLFPGDSRGRKEEGARRIFGA